MSRGMEHLSLPELVLAGVVAIYRLFDVLMLSLLKRYRENELLCCFVNVFFFRDSRI